MTTLIAIPRNRRMLAAAMALTVLLAGCLAEDAPPSSSEPQAGQDEQSRQDNTTTPTPGSGAQAGQSKWNGTLYLNSSERLTLDAPVPTDQVPLKGYEEVMEWTIVVAEEHVLVGGEAVLFVDVGEDSLHGGEDQVTSGIRPCTWEPDLRVTRGSTTITRSPNCASESPGIIQAGVYEVRVNMDNLLSNFPLEIQPGDELTFQFMHRIVNGDQTSHVLVGGERASRVEFALE